MILISLLRGINVGGHNQIKMDALRELYESLSLRDVQTYVQSGNVVFKSELRDHKALANRIENAIEKSAGFRPNVILRTSAEIRDVIERCPFAARRDIDPRKLLVTFLTADPDPQACAEVRKIKCEPDEFHIDGREVYIYFPNGMGRPKFPWTAVEKKLKTPATSRNWNTVTKLLEIAEGL